MKPEELVGKSVIGTTKWLAAAVVVGAFIWGLVRSVDTRNNLALILYLIFLLFVMVLTYHATNN